MTSIRPVTEPAFHDSVLRITRMSRPPGLRLHGELDASRHAVFGAALDGVLAEANGSPVHLDLGGLGFIDLGALTMMATVASRRSPYGPLVLDRVSPQLARLMDVIGWHMTPGLLLGAVA